VPSCASDSSHLEYPVRQRLRRRGRSCAQCSCHGTRDADVSAFRKSPTTLPKLDGGVDQSATIAALLPAIGRAFHSRRRDDRQQGQRHRFGNMTLSRLPVLQVANHLLPWPRTAAVRSNAAPRAETTVLTAWGPLARHQHAPGVSLRPNSATRRSPGYLICSTRPQASRRWRRKSHASLTASQTTAASAFCAAIQFRRQQSAARDAAWLNTAGLNYRDAWLVVQPKSPARADLRIP